MAKHVRAQYDHAYLTREHRIFEKRAESWEHATIGLCTHVSATTRHPVFWVWTRRDRAICPPVWNNLTANVRHFSRFHRTRGYRRAISRTGILANRRHSPRPYLRSHCSTNGAFADTEAFVYIHAEYMCVNISLSRRAGRRVIPLPTRGKNSRHTHAYIGLYRAGSTWNSE